MDETLTQLPVTDFIRLCHRGIDRFCSQKLPSREDYSSTWSLQEWLQKLDSLAAIFRLAVGNNSSDEEVLASLSGIDNSHAQALLSVLRAREEEIRQALMHTTNSMSSTILQDFDWQLKLARSSDKISSLQTPLVSLCLDVREDGALRPVTLEISKEELNMLISSLESANKVVLQLK